MRYRPLIQHLLKVRALCVYQGPALRASQFLGRPLPCSQAAGQGQLGEGLLRLLVGLKSISIYQERNASDSSHPQLALFLDKLVLEKPPTFHVSDT